ncbi:MAG: M1 family metallopeptidase [Bacteroidota bacterium]
MFYQQIRILFFLIACLLSSAIAAQNDYFQQQVNYKIDVQLDDSLHVLVGTIEMEYINNSPDELNEIYMHLWPNAYANKETAFARQKLRTNSTKFYFAKKKDLGNLSNLNFQVNGEVVDWNTWNNQPDIAKLELKTPLAAGGSLNIRTPFTLKIPASFSRLGHVKESYQMTQWYPKPAVYDREGWHPMPYLDQGEFYSEFGNFEVSITLPENYVVGATGTLQTKSERQFLAEKIAVTEDYFDGDKDQFPADNAFPTSSKRMKTLRYTAENVHDFAWFADKRFRVLRGDVTLASGKKVDTWIMFTEEEEDLWKDAVEYVSRSVQFYSEKVGEYPYPHATAVQSALSAGGGMEYPMITVIGLSGTAKALDDVITHEVGHNWFYGILASNERTYPWMDEGMNSYYEFRYMQKYYGVSSSAADIIPKFLMGQSEMDVSEAGYLFQARRNLDQAPNTHSDSLTSINYGISAYVKPALAMEHLAAYLGKSVFDAAMQSYYDEWKFKHPYPADFRTRIEQSTGKNLDWFFDGYLYGDQKVDYALSSVKKEGNQLRLFIKNKGEIAAPFPIAAVKDGEVIESQWYEGFTGISTVDFPELDYDDLVIDVDRIILDVDRTNNRKKAPTPKANLLLQLEDDKKRSFSLFPALSWNQYDRFMLGIGIHNKSIPFRNFEFIATPMYAFSSQRLTGIGSLRYNIYPKSDAIERISLQLNGRTFSYSYNEDFDFHNYFTKFAPQLAVQLGKKTPTSAWQQSISYRYVNITRDFGRVNRNSGEESREQQSYAVNELNYRIAKSDALSPVLLSATLEQASSFTKLFTAYTQRFPYQEKDKGLRVRLFGGYFFNFNATEAAEAGVRPSFLLTGNTTGTFQQDYLYDQLLFARSATEGLLRHQIFSKDASFNTLTSVGASDNWMLSAGLRSTLPGALPVDIFGNFAYSNPENSKGEFFYSAGFALPIIKNVFEIYVPVLESAAINDNHSANGREGILERITFKLDLLKLNPFDLIDELDFN